MVFVEWMNEETGKLCLSQIPIAVFIQALFTRHASLFRYHKKGKAFAYYVPARKISFVAK